MNRQSDSLLSFQNRINWLLTTLLCAIATCLPLQAKAEDSVHVGGMRQGVFPVCMEMKHAMEAVTTWEKEAQEASAIYFEKPDNSCASMPMRFVVGNILYVTNVKDAEGNQQFLKLVEVSNPDNPNQKAYWVTTVKIEKAAPSTQKHTPDGKSRRSI